MHSLNYTSAQKDYLMPFKVYMTKLYEDTCLWQEASYEGQIKRVLTLQLHLLFHYRGFPHDLRSNRAQCFCHFFTRRRYNDRLVLSCDVVQKCQVDTCHAVGDAAVCDFISQRSVQIRLGQFNLYQLHCDERFIGKPFINLTVCLTTTNCCWTVFQTAAEPS